MGCLVGSGGSKMARGTGGPSSLAFSTRDSSLNLVYTLIVYLADNLDPISVFYLQNRYLEVFKPR